MFNSLKIPFAFLATGVCWALFSDPAITFLTKHLNPGEQDQFRSLNNFVFVAIIALVLYFEIKRQQQKLIRSEQEYRLLFESNPNPMWIYHNQTLRFVMVNNAAVEKYGYSKNTFLRMTIDDIRSTDEQHRLQDFLKEQSDGIRMAGIWEHTKATGEKFYVSITSHPVFFNNQNCKMVMITDKTQLLDKEKKLQDSYQKIRASNQLLLQMAWSNSHELRKPLCSIIGLIALMKQTTDANEKNELLNLLENCSTELDHILLRNNEEVSKIEMQEVFN